MTAHSRRVALVSGGGSQLVPALADALADVGFDVAIFHPQSAVGQNQSVEPPAHKGVRMHFCRGDIESAADRAAAVDAVRTQFGRLDAYIHCAVPVGDAVGDVLALSEPEFDRAIGVVLKGPYFFTQLIAQWMVEQRKGDAGYRGAIVNVTETRSTSALERSTAYHISRAGIGMATQLWAHRLAEFGVAVYEVRLAISAQAEVAPTETDRPRLGGAPSECDDRREVVDELGRAVAMLVQGELASATGNVLHIGGWHALRRL